MTTEEPKFLGIPQSQMPFAALVAVLLVIILMIQAFIIGMLTGWLI